MRALTLKPWWAFAVAHLGKDIENRTRPIPAALIGTRIAIHAGAGALSHVALADEAVRYQQDAGAPWPHDLPRGCIVATAVLAACVDEDQRYQSDEPRPPWAMPWAPYWWRLEEVITLRDPVPVQRGQLGLWRLDRGTVEAIMRAGGAP